MTLRELVVPLVDSLTGRQKEILKTIVGEDGLHELKVAARSSSDHDCLVALTRFSNFSSDWLKIRRSRVDALTTEQQLAIDNIIAWIEVETL